MAQLNDPFIGANWGWDEGEDGWGVGLNETLIQHSFLHNRRIDGIVGTLPDSPTDGQAYFLTSNSRVYFRASGSWYSSLVPDGMDFILKSTEEKYVFTGTTLELNTTESSTITYDNTTSGLTAEDVQSAIDEIAVDLDNKVDKVGGKQLSTEDYSTAEKSKLSGIASGATVNSPDATLLNRANHTGTQAQSTVVNLETDLAAKQLTSNLVQDLTSPNSTTYLSTQALASAFADIIAGESYQGEWNASTNTPTLVSSVGTEGFYYQVSTAGSTNLNGISSWALGDEVFFNGSVWLKRANYQSVVSVNGQTGPVVLDATDVGAVSSIAVSVPTGLQVAGSPITSSGTITITLQSGYSIPTTANQTNWSTAYTDRNKWDGGATGLVAATGRTSLGLGTVATLNTGTGTGDIPLTSQLNTRLGTTGNLGNAALATVTTSSTDTTAARLMVNGVHGLGSVSGSQDIKALATGVAVSAVPNSFVRSEGNVGAFPVAYGIPFSCVGAKFSYNANRGSYIFTSIGGAVRGGFIASTNDDTYSQFVEWWTPLNLVKTTSQSDSTAGSVLLTGSGGLLGNSIASNDWNAITASAFYHNTSDVAVGIPTNAAAISLIHINQSSTTATQMAFRSGSNQFWVRRKSSNTWQAWIEGWHSGNLVKVTSSTDETAGSVLTVGYKGLGALTANLKADTTEINAMRGTEVFSRASSSSNPYGVAGVGLHMSYSPTFAGQIFMNMNSPTKLFYRSTTSASTFGSPYEVYGTGNTSADVQTMLGSADNANIRQNLQVAKQTAAYNLGGATHNFAIGDDAKYHRFVYVGAKSATVRPTSTHSLGTNWAVPMRNVGTGNLTLIQGSGVTINPPYGGTLVLEPSMAATLIKVGIDEYDLIGQTVPA